MGEEEREELQTEVEEQKPEEKKFINFGAIIEWILSHVLQLVIAAIIAGTVSFIVVSQMRARISEEIVVQKSPLKKEPAPLTFDLGSFNINTSDIDEPHFARLKIYLGYPERNTALQAELSQRKFQIRDIVINVISSKRKEDLDESIERQELKEELKKLINNMLIEGEIIDIYFDEFTVY